MVKIKSREEILVAGTSYLLPFDKNWKILEPDYEVKFANFGDIMSALSDKYYDSVLLIILVLEDLFEYDNSSGDYLESKIKIVIDALETRSAKSSKPTVFIPVSITNYNIVNEARFESNEKIQYRKLVDSLRKVSFEYSSLFIIESSLLFENEGKRLFIDSRNWYFSRCRFSLQGIEKIIYGFKEVLERTKIPRSKVLVLDCDNTLWGGIVGEDLPSGINLGEDGTGKAFQDFQKEIYRLMNRGIILCLASKNNEQDVWDVFSNHKEMILKKEYISNWRINWKAKSGNISDLSLELGLSLNSFVFWDDNPVERLEVKRCLPDVKVIEVSKHVEDWPQQLRELTWFTEFEITTEDVKRNEYYKSKSEFDREIKLASDSKSFLNSIDMRISTKKLARDNLKRAEQLSLKTNQFNLRAQRYADYELQQMQNSDVSHVELISLSDCFGDHGTIGMFALTKIADKTMFLNIFLLSCRAIGRDIEFWMMDKIIHECSNQHISILLAEFVSTERNQIANGFLDSQGFIQIEKDHEIIKGADWAGNDISGTLFMRKMENFHGR